MVGETNLFMQSCCMISPATLMPTPVQRIARSLGSREIRNTSRSSVSPVSRAAGRMSITPTKSERTERMSRVVKRSRVRVEGLMVNTPLHVGLFF